MQYRPHKGSLIDSMAFVVEVSGRGALLEYLHKNLDFPFMDETLTVEPYYFDDRIGWDTHVVTVSAWPIGFTDGPLP